MNIKNEEDNMKLNNITFKVEKNVATITVNRPEVLNALNEETVMELGKAVEYAESEQRVKTVVITGTGKAFIAGADIVWMKNQTSLQIHEFLKLGKKVLDKIERMKKPTIASINGFAFGGGCEVALACDMRVASENSKFGQQEIALGIIPGWGATQRLPRLVGIGKAKELILTGDVIDALEALRIGLVNRVVPAEELEAEVKKLTTKLVEMPPIAIEHAKLALNSTLEKNQTAGMVYETDLCSALWDTEDQKEGMSAFLEKRKPKFIRK